MARRPTARPVADLFGVTDSPLWSGTPVTAIDSPYQEQRRPQPAAQAELPGAPALNIRLKRNRWAGSPAHFVIYHDERVRTTFDAFPEACAYVKAQPVEEWPRYTIRECDCDAGPLAHQPEPMTDQVALT